MWSLSLLLLLAFSGVMMADSREEYQKCAENLDLKKLEHLVDTEDESFLEVACPKVLGYMDCLEEIAKNEYGLTAAQLQVMSPNPQLARSAAIFNNVRGLLTDICTDGSDLNNAFKRNFHCLMDSTVAVINFCQDKARDAHRDFMGSIMDYEISYFEEDEEAPLCMKSVYTSACVATHVHDNCGREAFDFYQTIIKRSTVLKNTICSEGQLEEIKTDFLEGLEHDEEHHKDLFKLAFDLKRRRK